MTKSILIDIAEEYFKKTNRGPTEWNFYTFQYNNKIKPRKIENARKKFAPYDLETEIPIIVVDSTILRSGKDGVFITNKAVYYYLVNINGKGWRKGKVEWDEIEELLFVPKLSGSYFVINGVKIGQFGAFSQSGKADKEEGNVLNALFELWTDALKELRM
ncbi:MAG: hypothetical protein VB084_14835 [Syntrophomonadaceae bacterium]|nr:hypothetical protein [Syntrophomonadaceae bacterium]